MILITLITSCKPKEHIGSNKDEYIMSFKKAVLYECINSASNGNLYEFSRKNNDLGTAPEVAIIYHSDVFQAKELGIKLSKNIREINYSDYDGKKPIFSDCVSFAFSKQVDSIAKEKYKQLMKSKLEYKSE